MPLLKSIARSVRRLVQNNTAPPRAPLFPMMAPPRATKTTRHHRPDHAPTLPHHHRPASPVRRPVARDTHTRGGRVDDAPSVQESITSKKLQVGRPEMEESRCTRTPAVRRYRRRADDDEEARRRGRQGAVRAAADPPRRCDATSQQPPSTPSRGRAGREVVASRSRAEPSTQDAAAANPTHGPTLPCNNTS